MFVGRGVVGAGTVKCRKQTYTEGPIFKQLCVCGIKSSLRINFRIAKEQKYINAIMPCLQLASDF